jgi:hypothetical protein
VKTVAVVVVALVVLGAAPAWASHTDLTDPNDVDGRLDLKQVLLDHDADPFVWTFRTFRGWKPREMWTAGTCWSSWTRAATRRSTTSR